MCGGPRIDRPKPSCHSRVMNPGREQGWSILETIITIGVLGILIALALPAISSCHGCRGPMTQTLSNMKQLHLATQQMALDGTTTGETNTLHWPGDNGGTIARWATTLVFSNYLSTNDLCKMLSGPGRITPPGAIPLRNDNAVLGYAVGEETPSDAVFLTSANFTNTPAGGAELKPDAKPFGNKGFVVFRKGGDGAILMPKQVGQTNIIGLFVPLLK